MSWAFVLRIGVMALAAACGRSSPAGPSFALGSTNDQLVGAVRNPISGYVAGVHVAVTSGPSAGVVTLTDADGAFRVPYNFRSPGRLDFTKEGYAPWTFAPDRIQPSGVLSIILHLAEPPVHLAGEYRLQFIADSACTQLSVALRIRSYTATIHQPQQFPQSTAFDANLSGATFAPATLSGALDSFSGAAEGHTVRLGIANSLESIEGVDEGIAEQIAPDVRLEIFGSASVEVADPQSFSARMSGYFAVTDPTGTRKCTSTNHLMRFSQSAWLAEGL